MAGLPKRQDLREEWYPRLGRLVGCNSGTVPHTGRKGVPLACSPDLYPSSVVRHDTSPELNTVYSPQSSATHPLGTAVPKPQPRISFQARITAKINSFAARWIFLERGTASLSRQP